MGVLLGYACEGFGGGEVDEGAEEADRVALEIAVASLTVFMVLLFHSPFPSLLRESRKSERGSCYLSVHIPTASFVSRW